MHEPRNPEEHIPEADAHEQRRPLVEAELDPEDTAEWRSPGELSTEADPADAHDQATEVGDDLDDEYVEP